MLIRGSLFVTILICSGVPAIGQDYEVSGQDENGAYVYGEIDADSGDRDVDGYIYTESGEEKYFEGEWVGHGEIEGYDEDGNFVELEVD